jgi:hypothetical protein
LDADDPDGGTTKKHLIYSLNLDTGAINPGWPVDVNARSPDLRRLCKVNVPRSASRATFFTCHMAVMRGLWNLSWMAGRVQMDDPTIVMAWATDAIGGGAWATGGVASDGNNPFMATGNTFNTGGNWGGGEAIIRFQPGPIFTGDPSDYWAPTNWVQLDNGDVDLGGSGPLLVDVPGAMPSSLVVALGKDGNAYLLNRDNLGGILRRSLPCMSRTTQLSRQRPAIGLTRLVCSLSR